MCAHCLGHLPAASCASRSNSGPYPWHLDLLPAGCGSMGEAGAIELRLHTCLGLPAAGSAVVAEVSELYGPAYMSQPQVSGT